MCKKRTSVVTVRLPDFLKSDIEKLAKEKDWTISHTVYRLILFGLYRFLSMEVSGNE